MTVCVEERRVSQTALDEERLMVERARRDPAAFGDLYSRYSNQIYAYAYKRTHDREDAEDITSDTFMLAFEAMDRYEWRNVPFGAWLFRIASNVVAAHYRKKRHSTPIDDVVLYDTDVDPERDAIRSSDADDLRRAVSLLKGDQRRVVELRYDEDMCSREIAQAMGRTEGSVRTLLHRATRSLRSQMLPLSA